MMVTTIKKGFTKQELQTLFDRLVSKQSSGKGFDALKYCGKVSFKADGLAIQKKLRDEWE